MDPESDRDQREGVPYVPQGAERMKIATALRMHIVSVLGGYDTIMRFKNGTRYKVTLPHGEELLRYAAFERTRLPDDVEELRVFVQLPCPLPRGGGATDPYHGVFKFIVPKKMALNPFGEDDEVPVRRHGYEAVTAQPAIARETGIRRAALVAAILSGAMLTATFVQEYGDDVAAAVQRVLGEWGKKDDVPPLKPSGNPWHWPR